MIRKLLLVSLFILPAVSHADSGKWWEKITKEYENSVVQVETISHIGLNLDAADELAPSNSGAATGFIVDSNKGIIVSNYHVITASPNIQTKIRFKNGQEIDAKVLYVDPWVDFGFLKYEPKDLNFKPKEIVLGSQKDLRADDEVVLMGNSSNTGISVKPGYINYLFRPRISSDGLKPHHTVHATLARAGGASGSPVWNKSGRVIGLHEGGKDFEAFFVRIDYVKDALLQLQKGEQPRRGELFFNYIAIKESDVKRFFFVPDDLMKKGVRENNGPHHLLKVSDVLPGTQVAQKIESGDFIISVQGKNNTSPVYVGNSIYQFEKIVNENVDGRVSLTVFRPTNKKTLTFDLPVTDANASIPKEYAMIGSAVFQSVTARVGLMFGVPLEGVFIPFIGDIGSTTWDYGRKCVFSNEADVRARCILIREINGVPVKNIQDFNNEMKKHLKSASVLISMVDFADYDRAPNTKYVDLKIEEDISLKRKTFSIRTLDWTTEEIKP